MSTTTLHASADVTRTDRGLTSECDTRLVHAGRDPDSFGGLVNIPACRGSTILASSLEEWESRKLPGNSMASYGRMGTAGTRALETAVAELEGVFDSIESLRRGFEEAYHKNYGFSLPDSQIVVESVAIEAAGRHRHSSAGAELGQAGKASDVNALGTTQLYSAGELHDVPIYDHASIGIGDAIQGPAVVSQIISPPLGQAVL